jgi:hypothetical protein
MMGVEGGEFAGWGKTGGEGRRKSPPAAAPSRVEGGGSAWRRRRERERERGREANSLLNVMISSLCWSVC